MTTLQIMLAQIQVHQINLLHLYENPIHNGHYIRVHLCMSQALQVSSYHRLHTQTHIQKMAQTSDGTVQPIRGTGVVKCTPIKLHYLRFYMFPPFQFNLVSISSLVHHMDCRVSLDRENCLI